MDLAYRHPDVFTYLAVYPFLIPLENFLIAWFGSGHRTVNISFGVVLLNAVLVLIGAWSYYNYHTGISYFFALLAYPVSVMTTMFIPLGLSIISLHVPVDGLQKRIRIIVWTLLVLLYQLSLSCALISGFPLEGNHSTFKSKLVGLFEKYPDILGMLVLLAFYDVLDVGVLDWVNHSKKNYKIPYVWSRTLIFIVFASLGAGRFISRYGAKDIVPLYILVGIPVFRSFFMAPTLLCHYLSDQLDGKKSRAFIDIVVAMLSFFEPAGLSLVAIYAFNWKEKLPDYITEPLVPDRCELPLVAEESQNTDTSSDNPTGQPEIVTENTEPINNRGDSLAQIKEMAQKAVSYVFESDSSKIALSMLAFLLLL